MASICLGNNGDSLMDNKQIKFCKNQGKNGHCKDGRLTLLAEPDNAEIVYKVPYKCPYTINSLQLKHDGTEDNLFELVVPQCKKFKAIEHLDTMLQLCGDLTFSKTQYIVIETDEEYYVARDDQTVAIKDIYRKRE